MPDDRIVMTMSAMAAPALMLATWHFAQSAVVAWPRMAPRLGYAACALASLALSAAFWALAYARI